MLYALMFWVWVIEGNLLFCVDSCNVFCWFFILPLLFGWLFNNELHILEVFWFLVCISELSNLDCVPNLFFGWVFVYHLNAYYVELFRWYLVGYIVWLFTMMVNNTYGGLMRITLIIGYWAMIVTPRKFTSLIIVINDMNYTVNTV